MTINKITIENVKGFSSKELELDILPNRPSLLVAPNGFGKSSLATAFMSMNANRIILDDEHCYQGDTANLPSVTIEFTDSDSSSHTLQATSSSNNISNHFDIFVINNKIKAKGVGRNFGGRSVVSSSIVVEPVTLVDTIPQRELFNFSFPEIRRSFGNNNKVLINISSILGNKKFISKISSNYSLLDRCIRVTDNRQVAAINGHLNSLSSSMSAENMRQWASRNISAQIESIESICDLINFIRESNLGYTDLITCYLIAYQLITLYGNDKQQFKKACKYNEYLLKKQHYSEMLSIFNSSWQGVAPRERSGKLIVEFPKSHFISNGQRDVITFITYLCKAQDKLKKNNSILIIDEVFDYLDDANLVSVQYYITKIIEYYKSNEKRIYPLILTHLNPLYFKNFAFSKQRVYFLDKKDIQPNNGMVNLLRKRNEESIKNDVSKFLLHYHPEQINKRGEFLALQLPELWGESDHFDNFVNEEARKYIDGNGDFDPFSVCCFTRKKVEKHVFLQIETYEDRETFISTFKTKEKLKFCESLGIHVPEYFYLLGVIYNDGMHWKNNVDNVSPIAAKLENVTIKNLISNLSSL
ncbi:hypothetical protein [Shewanella algae]|uniref:hypothetical protein n=1 Tax=Shewanella algae TaxID=38313 RepID=UPI0030050DF7